MRTLHIILDRRTLLAGLLLSTLASSARGADPHAEAVIAEIYRMVSGPNPISIVMDAAMRKKFCSRRLQDALRAMEKRTPEGDAPDLDFDPITNSNDPNVNDLRLKTESETPTRAVVIADFRSHQDKARTVLRYALVREGGWKIDNIIASGKNEWNLIRIVAGH